MELARHLQGNSCQSPTSNYVVGISNDLQDRPAKLLPRNTDEECWRGIFSVFFPSHQGPVSPYLQGSFENHVSEVQRLWEAEGIAIAVGCLRRICWQEEEAGDGERCARGCGRRFLATSYMAEKDGWLSLGNVKRKSRQRPPNVKSLELEAVCFKGVAGITF